MITHVLMLKDTPVIGFNMDDGIYELYNEQKQPINLPLLFNTPVTLSVARHNDNAMQRWCADRTLSMSQKHAKAIRNALSLTQDDSDFTKCKIALSYRCLSLDDSYWVKKADENITWKDVNLFNNPNKNILTPISLKGTMSTIFNEKLKNCSDLGVDGTFAKSWVKENGILHLLKADDDSQSTETINEVCASRVLDCFNIPHATYELSDYEGTRVSKTPIFTDEDHGLVKYKAFQKYYGRIGIDALEQAKSMFPEDFNKLCIATYLIGNEDLHNGNWGFIQDANKGVLTGMAPLYDFNYAFTPYYLKGHHDFPFAPESKYIGESGEEIFDSRLLDEIDARIQKGRSIEVVAMEAMKHANIVQTKEVTPDLFPSEQHFEEFVRRCNVLKLDLNKNFIKAQNLTNEAKEQPELQRLMKKAGCFDNVNTKGKKKTIKKKKENCR